VGSLGEILSKMSSTSPSTQLREKHLPIHFIKNDENLDKLKGVSTTVLLKSLMIRLDM
jgi:hypothetical protein